MLRVILFDVNESPLGVTALDPHFARIFGDATARQGRFDQILRPAATGTSRHWGAPPWTRPRRDGGSAPLTPTARILRVRCRLCHLISTARPACVSPPSATRRSRHRRCTSPRPAIEARFLGIASTKVDSPANEIPQTMITLCIRPSSGPGHVPGSAWITICSSSGARRRSSCSRRSVRR